jgi:hypothetical protein
MVSFQFMASQQDKSKTSGHGSEHGGLSNDGTSRFIKLNILLFMTTEHASSQKQWMVRKWSL